MCPIPTSADAVEFFADPVMAEIKTLPIDVRQHQFGYRAGLWDREGNKNDEENDRKQAVLKPAAKPRQAQPIGRQIWWG